MSTSIFYCEINIQILLGNLICMLWVCLYRVCSTQDETLKYIIIYSLKYLAHPICSPV